MTDKTNFTPEEWKLLLESVMMAGIAVSAAEPSGLSGLLKESFASGNALLTAKMDPGFGRVDQSGRRRLRDCRRAKHRARRPQGEVGQAEAHGQRGEDTMRRFFFLRSPRP